MKRHQTAKHGTEGEEAEESTAGEDIWTRTILVTLQNYTSNKLSNNLCYPKQIREEFYPNLVAGFTVDSEEKLLEKVKLACGFVAKDRPNVEKFFTAFYCSVVKHAQEYFPTLSPKAATLFATTLANKLLEHAKQSYKSSELCQPNSSQPLTERELAGLQYLGGYVFRNLYRRLHKSQTWKTQEGQQMLSVIEAAKEASVPSSDRLVSCLNRGGLWSICTTAQNILARAEMHFKVRANVQSIDHTEISKICLMDHEIMANYQSIVEMSSIEVCKDVSKDVLQQIIDLFVRMRCYTYSRDIVQQYKRKQKLSKSKALRKTIERSSRDNL